MSGNKVNTRALRMALMGATILSGLASSGAMAQDASAPAAAPALDTSAPSTPEIVVSGYRRSLTMSTNEKRRSVSFTDSIFAEDIGKFPDTNIAESFNRIPGITITRDITGEGANVAIRGLGANFTNVTLNGAPIAVASSGVTDAQGTDRSVDLSFFPTELFTKLTVNKSYSPDLLEGGAAGNIDMRSARPFDNPGTHIAYNVQGVKHGIEHRLGGRGSLIASATSDTFGVLVGVSAQRLFTDTRGYETIGFTNPNLSAAQFGAATGANTTGGGNWTIPATVPAGANIPGVAAGTPINQALLLQLNPGASIQQIDNGILPRIGRPSAEYGSRDRFNAVASLEWRPSDRFHAFVDGIYGVKYNKLIREDMMWTVRNGSVIPMNTTYDRTDCSAGCVVNSGTYANSQFFLEFRPYEETTRFTSVNPGFEWSISDKLKVNLQGNYTHSTFHRESPTAGPTTLLGSGVTVNFVNNPNGIPTISSSVDLNNPANFQWNGGRLNISDERRDNKTRGIRGDVSYGDDSLKVKFGGGYDDISRFIHGYDNSQAWQNYVCGGAPNVFLPSPNSQPSCLGLAAGAPGLANNPTYPGYGTGYTAGATGGITYAGSAVPNASLANFLMPGRAGFVTVNWPAFAAATNYQQFHDSAPETGGTNTGASGGFIREKALDLFGMVTGKTELLGNDLRASGGMRYVYTKQQISGFVSNTDPRNILPSGAQIADGSRYPNVSNLISTYQSYSAFLPAFNLSYTIGGKAVMRAAWSKTMTRPDPSAMLPGASFGAPSADQASLGNPSLSPYFSQNIDLGFEYYPGREAVLAVNAFHKSIDGFTTTMTTTQPFSALAQYGITYDTLNPTQQTAINLRGGPNVAQVQISSPVNIPNQLHIKGLEFQWVQPLDFLTGRLGFKGLGFNANATIVRQKSNGAAIAYNVAPFTYNVTVYYEQHGVNLRLSTTFREGSQSSGANQNGIAAAALFNGDYRQYDFSSSFDLEKILKISHAPQLTFDVANLTDATLRSYFQYPNATFTQYRPGRQFMVGVRGRF